MALTFTQAKATLDDVSVRIETARKRMESARAAYGVAQNELGSIPSAYATFITDLEAAAAADTWPQADVQKAEKDQMVADYQALKSYVDGVIAAIDAL